MANGTHPSPAGAATVLPAADGTLSGEHTLGGRLTDREPAPVCPDASHVGSRVRRRGLRTSAAGTRQRFECVPDVDVKHRPQVEASVPCERSGSRSCPDCWEGHGCPRDTLYQPVTRVAVLGERGRLTKKGINDRLFGSRPDRRINAWPGTHPREAAYMAWLVFTFTTEEDRVLAANDYLAVAMAKDLHLLEPRLARVACQTLAESRGLAAARVLAEKVLATRSTDPAYDELALWMTWHEQAAVQAARRQAPRTITHPRLARPAGRVNHNPYLPR